MKKTSKKIPTTTVAQHLPPDEISKLIGAALERFNWTFQAKVLKLSKEDIQQDIWLKLLSSNYDSKKSSPSSFVFMCTQSYFINAQRKSHTSSGLVKFNEVSYHDEDIVNSIDEQWSIS
jgi:DNA-directed RNA polymerase specialized sigma24 family protein